MWHDFRYAIRTLQRNPGFAFGVLLVLIVGIGANTVIFSVIKAVLLTPLPYPDPDRLVMLWQRNSQRGLNRERAQRGAVLRMVLRQGLKLTIVGLLIGLAGSLALRQVIASLLFGVSATEPATFVLVFLLLTAVAAAASFVPARRATKIDPMVALRFE